MPSRSEKQAEYAKLNALVEEIANATKAAVEYADLHGLEFSFPEPAYGMGGNYYGKGHEYRSDTDRWGEPSNGWNASSQSC